MIYYYIYSELHEAHTETDGKISNLSQEVFNLNLRVPGSSAEGSSKSQLSPLNTFVEEEWKIEDNFSDDEEQPAAADPEPEGENNWSNDDGEQPAADPEPEKGDL
jgi:hypothetical protein